MAKLFAQVPGPRIGRSVFDLSYDKKLTCDMGQLIPIMCDEVMPGDLFEIANQLVIRFNPMVAPILHEIWATIHYFFVNYRILWTGWEAFITGGVAGDDASVLPRWDTPNTAAGTLWDYFGFPVGVDPLGLARPIDFPRRAYNRIWNEFYRDETIQTAVAETNETILNRAWAKDYFTSSLISQQRGVAPSLPLSGQLPLYTASQFGVANRYLENRATGSTLNMNMHDSTVGVNPDQYFANAASAATFNVSDLRLAFQIQKFMERAARGGVRYTEFLQAMYGVSPRDERLQRPEYIGGSKSPVVVSEVLKTSSDGSTPQGNLAGHGLVADKTYAAKYHVQEFGLIIGLLSVMPKPAYASQGVDRQWLRRTRYDFPNPLFANLSEQAVEVGEIYARNNEAQNRQVFGFQGRYDEARVKNSQVCGLFRDPSFASWHLARIFTGVPALNDTFLQCVPTKRFLAVPTQPALLVNVSNIIRAVRPLPIQAEPGLIDH